MLRVYGDNGFPLFITSQDDSSATRAYLLPLHIECPRVPMVSTEKRDGATRQKVKTEVSFLCASSLDGDYLSGSRNSHRKDEARKSD